MNLVDALGAALRDPVGLMRLARSLGREGLDRVLPETTAGTVAALTEVYFGDAVAPRKQAEAVAAIAANGHSLDTLVVIESLAGRLRDTRKKWRLRHELCRMRGLPSAIRRHGLALLKELAAPRKRRVGISVRRYEDQTWSMRINAPAEVIAELYDPFKEARDPVGALHAAVTGGEGVRTVLRPIVVIPLDAADKVLDGTGDETVFRCSDGVERTSTQIVSATLDEEWGFALIHPVEGPVDLARSKRMANAKQRTLAAVENPTCAWDGCRTPADECQVHHLHPWALGGHTVSHNLATCCAYHNGVNDDDPAAPPVRGRLQRVDGQVRRVFS